VLAACDDGAVAPERAPTDEVPAPAAATVVITSHWRVRVDDSLSLTVQCFNGGNGERTALVGAYSLLSRDSVQGPDIVTRQYYFEGSEVRRGLVTGEVWTSGAIRSPTFTPVQDWDGSYAHFYRLFTLRWGPGREPEVGTKVRWCTAAP
jgi:hypothetical protein